MAIERDVTLRFKTAYDGKGLDRAIRELQQLEKHTEASAQKLRVLQNIQASRAARESSTIDDRSSIIEARQQRRLEAQRAEARATEEAAEASRRARPPIEQLDQAKRQLGRTTTELRRALNRLGGEIPGAAVLGNALTHPFVAAAIAVGLAIDKLKAYFDEQERAAAAAARISVDNDPVILRLEQHKRLYAEAQAAAEAYERSRKEVLEGENSQDQRLAQGRAAIDREIAEQDAADEGETALAIARNPEQAAQLQADLAARRRQRALGGAGRKAALLTDVNRRTLQDAKDADAALPGAREAQARLIADANQRDALRKTSDQRLKELEAELVRSEAGNASVEEDRLYKASWGLLGRKWDPNLRPPEEVRAEIAREKERQDRMASAGVQDRAAIAAGAAGIEDLERRGSGGQGRRFVLPTQEALRDVESQGRAMAHDTSQQAAAIVAEQRMLAEAQRERDQAILESMRETRRAVQQVTKQFRAEQGR